MDRHRGRSLQVYHDIGADGLRLLAKTDRVNADNRYRMGDIDFAITHLERAESAERLLSELERNHAATNNQDSE